MARIPDEQIERLKQEVSVQRLVEAQGIELKRHGADLLGLCPFHDDREPSLVVSPKKNLWHCLGACQTGGSVIDWVMKSRGVSFRHAVELLRNEHPSLQEPARIVSKGTTEAVKLETPFEVNADDQRVLRQVVDYYHETLKQSPEALKYLEGRGLTHPEMIAQFRIGFANRSLGYRLPEKNRKSGAEIRGRLQQLGILRESGHEHCNGSIEDLGGSDLQRTVAHEGTHVGNDLPFINSFDPDTGRYNQALNITHGQTEFNAFTAGAGVKKYD
jgi:DNA primase catalytic core